MIKKKYISKTSKALRVIGMDWKQSHKVAAICWKCDTIIDAIYSLESYHLDVTYYDDIKMGDYGLVGSATIISTKGSADLMELVYSK